MGRVMEGRTVLLWMLITSSLTSVISVESQSELKDDGDGLTGPQPSVIGSVDKVFKQVNQFDQYQCLQKMICQFMGTAGEVVSNSVNNNFGSNSGQIGQFAQQNFQQFANNPNQFVQQFPNQVSAGGQQFTNQLVGNNRPIGQFINNGQQFVQTGQQLVQNQYPNQFSNNFQTQFASPSNNFQTQFASPSNQFSQSQFVQTQPQQSSGSGLGDIASTLLSVLGKRRRRKRQTTMHGQAIRLMQTMGLNNMGAYPFVRAAILGHANRDNPTNCRITYDQCPSDTDLLLNYFNNHNGGLFQNTLPSVTNEVGSLFPGLNNLPQIAASTFGDTISSSSSNRPSSSSSGSGDGLLDNFVDNLAGMIAQASLGRKK